MSNFLNIVNSPRFDSPLILLSRKIQIVLTGQKWRTLDVPVESDAQAFVNLDLLRRSIVEFTLFCQICGSYLVQDVQICGAEGIPKCQSKSFFFRKLFFSLITRVSRAYRPILDLSNIIETALSFLNYNTMIVSQYLCETLVSPMTQHSFCDLLIVEFWMQDLYLLFKYGLICHNESVFAPVTVHEDRT